MQGRKWSLVQALKRENTGKQWHLEFGGHVLPRLRNKGEKGKLFPAVNFKNGAVSGAYAESYALILVRSCVSKSVNERSVFKYPTD